MATLSIEITLPDEELARMLAAFARRFRNPGLTQEQMLYGLKQNAIQQINAVVVAEERAAIEEQKANVTPLNMV